DAAQSDEQRQMFAFVSAPNDLGQPFAAPPGIPADRLAAFRRAFETMAGDPAFRAEAEGARLGPRHLTGEGGGEPGRRIVGAAGGNRGEGAGCYRGEIARTVTRRSVAKGDFARQRHLWRPFFSEFRLTRSAAMPITAQGNGK